MGRYPSLAVEIARTAPRTARRIRAPELMALLIFGGLLAGVALLLYAMVDGAAPAAALSVIAETFDKGF